MAHKKKHRFPVPKGNQSKAGPAGNAEVADQEQDRGAPFNDQDPKRRIGGYETAGEHSRQQPSDLNDGNHHSK